MLTINYETLAGAKGSTTTNSPSSANAWLRKFNSPNILKAVVTNKNGDQVGAKKFLDNEIVWSDQIQEKVQKARVVLGCKSTIASLDEVTIRHAKIIGGGNLSLGLRMAVAAMDVVEPPSDEFREVLRSKLEKMSKTGSSMFEVDMPQTSRFDDCEMVIIDEAAAFGLDVRVEEIRATKGRLLIARS